VADRPLTFDDIWSRWVVPLQGETIKGLNGLQNEILKVDRSGVVRVSRNDLVSKIPIEPFRWVVDELLAGRAVLRQEINEAFPHRYSSGVFLVLEQVPIFKASGRPAQISTVPSAVLAQLIGDRT
jgi:hypothetical protein